MPSSEPPTSESLQKELEELHEEVEAARQHLRRGTTALRRYLERADRSQRRDDHPTPVADLTQAASSSPQAPGRSRPPAIPSRGGPSDDPTGAQEHPLPPEIANVAPYGDVGAYGRLRVLM